MTMIHVNNRLTNAMAFSAKSYYAALSACVRRVRE